MISALETVLQDIRYAVRALRKAPAFALAALAALTLGIGANSAIFSVVNAVLLRPAPYPDPDRLVIFGYTFQGVWVPWSSPAKFNAWRQHATAFHDIAAVRFRRVNLTDEVNAEQVPAGQVSADFFKLLGASTAKGRLFTADEDRPNGGHVVVLGDGFWRRRFGGDPQIVGRSVPIDGSASLVVGILNPFDTAIFNASPDVWIPLQLDPNSTEHPPSLRAAARLDSGVSLAWANGQLQIAGREFRRRFPEAAGQNDTFSVAPLEDVMVRGVRPSLFVLGGAVGFVLLIACANVANLLLVRTSVRQREIAIRAAIGASRGRIARQLLTESLVLSLTGGALGLALGAIGIRALLVLNPTDLPRIGPHALEVTADWRVLAFTLVVSIVTGLVFGVLPALHVSRGDLGVALTEAGGRSGTGGGHRTVGSLLAVAEMALALVLLVGVALLIRTFVALRTVDRGFERHQILTMRMSLSGPRYATTAAVGQLIRDGVQRINLLPGVVGTAAAGSLPLVSDWLTSFSIVGRPPERPPRISERIISPSYFTAANIPVIRGRAFTDGDAGGALPVAIINETLARQWWREGDPLHDRLVAFPGPVPGDEPVRQIVGVVGDVRDGLALNPGPHPTIYMPLSQLPDRQTAGMMRDEPLAWIVRTRAEPRALGASIQRELQQLSGGAPITQVRSMDDVVTQTSAGTNFSMVVLTIFGASALVLAAIGVYGVMTYAVQQRTHEIGVRLALGADGRQVRNMMLTRGMALALFGVAIGLTAAFGLTHVLTAFIYGVTPHDRVAFIVAPLTLGAVAFVAVWLPARRAAQVDPLTALRCE